MVTTTEIAWAAGIYEGEGSFSGTHVLIAQKDPWLLRKLNRIFGFGNVLPRNGDGYGWNAAGQNARSFLLTIFTFLSPRRKVEILRHKIFFIDSKFRQRSICNNGHELDFFNTRRKYSPRTKKFYTTCLICQADRRKKQTDRDRRLRQLGVK